jgi:hypothetical protein
MTVGKIVTKSTSNNSAEISNIILRETSFTRLIFKPQLVTNNKNPQASVNGTFIFQRKGKNDIWENFHETPLSKLKKGEHYKLFLHSQEVLKLFNDIADLYQIYNKDGIPQGNQTFINITNNLQDIANLSDNDFKQVIETGNDVWLNILFRLIRWASSINEFPKLLAQLENLDINSLKNIHTLSGIATLQNALDVWKRNAQNPSEQFWQIQFIKQSFLLEQIFSYPVLLIKEKAYMGGKSIYNDGGNYCDFLYENTLTKSAIIVEIKTPTTPILGGEYRKGTYNASSQLTGAILQVLDYRKSFTEEIQNLRKGDEFDTCDPPCKVIIGNTSELDDSDKKKSFELFRRHFNGVEILTYDEIFLRISNLLTILVGEEA